MQVTQADPNLSAEYDTSLMRSIQETSRAAQNSQPSRIGDDEHGTSEVELSNGGHLLNALSGKGDLGESILNLMKRALELLTGKKVESLSVDQQSLNAGSIAVDETDSTLSSQSTQGTDALDFQYHSLHAETQQLDYAASGTLKLKNGTEVQFSFALSISQVYVQETSASLQLRGDVAPAAGSTLPATATRQGDNAWHFALDGAGLKHLLNAFGRDDDEHHVHHRHRHHDHANAAPVPVSSTGAATTAPAAGDAAGNPPASAAPAATDPVLPASTTQPGTTNPTVPTPAPQASAGDLTPSASRTQVIIAQQFMTFLSGYSFYQGASNSSPFLPTINAAA